MNEGGKPIPVPRPRQTKASDETDTSSKVYENYTIPSNKSESIYDSLNAQLSELKADAVHRPVPTPRARVTTAAPYENAPDTARPPLNNKELSPTRNTGAIRKAPNIPSVKNNLDEPDHVHVVRTAGTESLKDFDVLSQTSSNSAKSGGDSKFNTPSPG